MSDPRRFHLEADEWDDYDLPSPSDLAWDAELDRPRLHTAPTPTPKRTYTPEEKAA